MPLTPEQQKALDDSYKVTAEAERVLAESLAESAANDSNLGDEGDDPQNLVIDAGGSTEARDYYEGTKKEYTEADAQAERDAQRARMQNQIDTITNNYSDYVANIKQKGEEDATRTSLISGASGLLGSPRATTQIDRTKQLTQDQVDASNAQRDLKIQAVKDKGDAIAELKIEAERTKATGNTEAYLTYLDKVQTDSRANWAALAQAGVYSIEDIKLASTEGGQSGDYYKQMLEDTGWNELMLDSMFNASLPKAEQVDYNYTWKGNNLVVTSVGSDGTLSVDTYTADDLGIPTGTNVKFITDVPSGEMFWYDEDNPLDENGNLKTTKLEGISAGVEETGVDSEDQQAMSFIKSGVSSLMDKWRAVDVKYKGSIEGRTPLKGEQDPAVQAFDTSLGYIGQQLAKLVENGRLTDQDRKFYMGLMPTRIQEDEEAAQVKVDEMIRLLDLQLSGQVSTPTVPSTGGTINVRVKETGIEGTIPEDEFNEAIYEKI